MPDSASIFQCSSLFLSVFHKRTQRWNLINPRHFPTPSVYQDSYCLQLTGSSSPKSKGEVFHSTYHLIPSKEDAGDWTKDFLHESWHSATEPWSLLNPPSFSFLCPPACSSSSSQLVGPSCDKSDLKNSRTLTLLPVSLNLQHFLIYVSPQCCLSLSV